MNYVYHGSTIPNLKTIKKHSSTHQKEWVYATPLKELAIMFISTRGGDLYYDLSGNGIDEPITLVERKPGMFKNIYNCEGYIYKLNAENFKAGLTNWSGEVVSDRDEKIISCEHINNIYEELLKLNREKRIKLYLYPNRPEYIPIDNSDLIPKVISWENKGFGIDEFFRLYPELQERFREEKNNIENRRTK